MISKRGLFAALTKTCVELHARSTYLEGSYNLSFRSRRIFVSLLAASCLVFAGCEQKSLTPTEARSITSEIVGAAQRVTDRRSEITIRPGSRSSRSFTPDHIYVSLNDLARTNDLKHAFNEIARRHHLSLGDTSTDGGLRFEFAFEGANTQIVHVVIPLSSRAKSGRTRNTKIPQLAIILDDMGYDQSAADSLLSLPFTLTLSVLPHLPLSTEVAEEAYRRGDQVMLHLPMQPESATPEGVELRVGMNAEQVNSTLAGMLETVPHVAGVNNHEGSRATADPALMEALMPALRQRGLFFVDSRTTAATVAYDAAEHSGVRAASRKVFLDDTVSREAIRAQLDLAARDAERDGSAIAIGHPHPETIAALAEGVPPLESRGIRLVFASQLVH